MAKTKEKLNYHKKKKLFYKSCGYTPSGAQKKWWLGYDENIGQIIFHRIKSEWKMITQSRKKKWTLEKIDEIENFKKHLYEQVDGSNRQKEASINKEDVDGSQSVPLTFYQAIDYYNSNVIPKKKTITQQWARDLGNRMISLKDALADLALIEVSKEQLVNLVNYYVNRPFQKVHTKKRITITTAKAQIKTAKCLFDWLEDEGYWQRCKNYRNIFDLKSIKWKRDKAERLKSIQGKPIFNIDELSILYQNASPTLKEFMIFALNCGFTQLEIDRLLAGECKLDAKEPYITRLREKTQSDEVVIGKWILWKETLEITTRRIDNKPPWEYKRIGGKIYVRYKTWNEWKLYSQQGDSWWEYVQEETKDDKKIYKRLTATDYVFCWDRPLVYLNESGAKTDKVGSAWWRLLRKCKKVRQFSFKSLRKTSADFIEKLTGSEKMADVFLCHSPTTTTGKSYTDPDFDRLSQALTQLRQIYDPVFSADYEEK